MISVDTQSWTYDDGMDSTPVDLDDAFAPTCAMEECGKPASYLVQGCCDKAPALLCDDCYTTALTRLVTYLRLYQRVNKRVMICGDCHRPVLTLSTHLEVSYLEWSNTPSPSSSPSSPTDSCATSTTTVPS